MNQYMLDTNTVCNLVRQQVMVVSHIVSLPMAAISISAITAGEMLFGLAKHPVSTRLHIAIQEFLQRVQVFPWELAAAEHYAVLRADLQRRGAALAPIDMLIAAHALAVNAVLVTNDQAFSNVPGLAIEDWTR